MGATARRRRALLRHSRALAEKTTRLEADAEGARRDASLAERTHTEACRSAESARAAATQAQGAVTDCEALAQRITAEIRETHVLAEESQDAYWDDAPFLDAEPQAVHDLREELAARREAAAVLELEMSEA